MVVCGPTASGKTALADGVADYLSGPAGPAQTLVVDSMQVYKELPVITNQARDRPAELVSITSVTDDWTMARHRFAADGLIDGHDRPVVLDAGTGMYLNALLLDIDLAPKVPEKTREEAEALVAGAMHPSPNPRRSMREKELELSGARKRGSIWSGVPRYDVNMVYLRPRRETLDSSITLRSSKIVREGLEEAETLRSLASKGQSPNPSVLASIGVKELSDVLSGLISTTEAEARISTRTRRLARRQMRWFDKLALTLEGEARVTTQTTPGESPSLNSMFDILGT
ncbi:MAG: hypothetical protein WA990_16360 [Rubrobacteraceae bacterium]